MEIETGLQPAADADFAWMMGEADAMAPGQLRLPEGGIEDPAVLGMLRRIANEVRAATGGGAWMIVSQSEVVGLVSFVKPPDGSGSAEIGYGVAASRRALGHATRAITLVVDMLRHENTLRELTAGTATRNIASQRVLERAGFAISGSAMDDDEGELLTWRLALR